MSERLSHLVDLLHAGGDAGVVAGLSAGERCYVALAAGRYELLPRGYADPIEAWSRLDAPWRAAVCRARGWPEEWAWR